ncbi:Crp/Fnr family transcriptional regulator [Roseicella frigidaeris]|uniref:Crp/Fnr family transcriptional regulator n=1 Tax=Roseicella frigidaeris TaxID=2230885 RepID=A0A327M4D7_9PROT|nr:Crp/Fnr family transcriptional regulator [Roseicella frigidaeris]RAI57082.1 Crp/Fnr family transcriptional regulator [Roseicella frigidaeris]
MPQQGDADFLGCTELFGGLDPKVLEGIAARGTSRLVRAGQAVFRQGSEPTHLHLVMKGWVKIGHVTGSGAPLTIGIMEPGDVPGCVAVFRHTPYPATATAIVDSWLLTWPAAVVSELMERHPRISANALGLVGGRTEEMLHRSREFATEPVECRIARVLLRLAAKAGQPVGGGTEIIFPLSRQDIAEMAGTTLHTVSRTLRMWQRSGLVAGGRRRVVIQDEKALRAVTLDH